MRKRTGRVGAKVRCGRYVAFIKKLHPQIAIGAVELDRAIDGLKFWNMDSLKSVSEKKKNSSILENLIYITPERLGQIYVGPSSLFENGSSGYFDIIEKASPVYIQAINKIYAQLACGEIANRDNAEKLGLKRPLRVFTGDNKNNLDLNILGLSVFALTEYKPRLWTALIFRTSFRSRKLPFKQYRIAEFEIRKSSNGVSGSSSITVNGEKITRKHGKWTVKVSLFGFSLVSKYDFTDWKWFEGYEESSF